MHELLEETFGDITYLSIPIEGKRYLVRPVSIDDWSRLSQGVRATQRRLSGEANRAERRAAGRLDPHATAKLALGDTRSEIAESRPGIRWEQEAALVATYWHLSGFEKAKAYWSEVLVEAGL